MRITLTICATVFCVLMFSGCASIVTRTAYPVTIESTPSDARVSIFNDRNMQIFSGRTPATIVLNSSSGFFTPPRYLIEVTSSIDNERYSYELRGKIDGWYFGNILLGGFLGMLIIDPATGAMWKIDEQYIHFDMIGDGASNLAPSNPGGSGASVGSASSASSGSSLRIIELDDVPDDLREYMVQIV